MINKVLKSNLKVGTITELEFVLLSTMSKSIPLTPIDGIDVTIIVDNFISSLLPNNPPVNRISSIKNIKSNVTEEAMVKDRLKAEHGFSAWVSIDRGKNTHNLMFDTGVSPTGAIENLER